MCFCGNWQLLQLENQLCCVLQWVAAGAVGAVALFVVALCGLPLKGLGSTGAMTQIQMYLSLTYFYTAKIKLNGLKENYVSFMHNNNIFGVVFILKMLKKD